MTNSDNKLIWHRLYLEQLSPLHIGKKNYGVLSETRLFIPGWTIWGALVNSYGTMDGASSGKFEEAKQLLEKITCFYPLCLNKNGEKDIMFPKFKDGKLYLGDIAEYNFRAKFTSTFVSTAIDPKYIAAKDGSLHEIEIILPRAKGGKENIIWTGVIGVKSSDNNKFEKFLEESEEILVGGETTYGFGRMKLIDRDNTQIDKNTLLQNWGLNEKGELGSSETYVSRNYIEFSDDYEVKEGKLEFIVQYNFSHNVPSIETNQYCFVPGSNIAVEDKDFILKKGVLVYK